MLFYIKQTPNKALVLTKIKLMKRMTILILILILFSLQVFAPKEEVLYIEKAEPVYIYNADDPLLRAIMRTESNYNPLAVNPISKARGLLQITPAMITEVNRICKKLNIDESYTWDDAFDPFKSIRIWYIAQSHLNPEYDINIACQIWFGRGVQWDGMTWIEYSDRVKTYS